MSLRRQHPVGPYIFDFFCRAAGLAIEVDGFAHESGNNPERDQQRDAWAQSKGIGTLRIAASDVRDNLEAVVVQIIDECAKRTPPPAAPVPLPAKTRRGQKK